MRTTLDIDDDILGVARERARREHRSIGSVLSELARQALVQRSDAGDAGGDLFGFRPLPTRGSPVTNTVIDELLNDEPE
jgi:hypothetical protein